MENITMDKIASLSTIKRAVRTANTVLGTKFSPTEIYRRELAAREVGRTTRDYQQLIQFPRTRSDLKRQTPSGYGQAVGDIYLRRTYGAVADESPLIGRTLNAQPGNYFTKIGELIEKDGDRWKITKLNLSGSLGQANRAPVVYYRKNLPDGAVPATIENKHKIIREYLKQIHEANKYEPGSGYIVDVEAVELF